MDYIETFSDGGDPVRPDLRLLLGEEVAVKVDRALGSRHPDHPCLWYPLNYGYLPGILSGDGEPVDAYVVGVFEPVLEFTGQVVAVILRRDDVEDKLVVAPAGRSFTADQVMVLVEFQERFFHSEILVKP